MITSQNSKLKNNESKTTELDQPDDYIELKSDESTKKANQMAKNLDLNKILEQMGNTQKTEEEIPYFVNDLDEEISSIEMQQIETIQEDNERESQLNTFLNDSIIQTSLKEIQEKHDRINLKYLFTFIKYHSPKGGINIEKSHLRKEMNDTMKNFYENQKQKSHPKFRSTANFGNEEEKSISPVNDSDNSTVEEEELDEFYEVLNLNKYLKGISYTKNMK